MHPALQQRIVGGRTMLVTSIIPSELKCLFLSRRHHRYVFNEKEKREPGKKEKKKTVVARLQELGPRFTLKLLSLQKGTFDSKHGEYEWVHKTEAVTSRRRFFL